MPPADERAAPPPPRAGEGRAGRGRARCVRARSSTRSAASAGLSPRRWSVTWIMACRDRRGRVAGRRRPSRGRWRRSARAVQPGPGSDAARRRAWMTTPWRSGPTTAYALIGGRARRRRGIVCQLGHEGELRGGACARCRRDRGVDPAARPAGSRRPPRRAPARPPTSQYSRAAPASSPRASQHLGLDRGVHARRGVGDRGRRPSAGRPSSLLHPSGERDEHGVGGVVDGAHGAGSGLEHEVADGHGPGGLLAPAQLRERPRRDALRPACAGRARTAPHRQHGARCGRRGRARAGGRPPRRGGARSATGAARSSG